MIKSNLLDYLSENCIKFKTPVNTSNLVSFKVGGIGNIAIFPSSVSELCSIIRLIKTEKFVVLGKGTNCYFTDDFYDGIIVVTNNINSVFAADNIIYAECGASVNSVCNKALEYNLSGLEFAYGIPGTVGGAIYMNASAFGGCFADVLLKSKVLDIDSGKVFEIENIEHEFNVKKSVFQKGDLFLLGSYFSLVYSKKEIIEQKMREILQKRIDTQPLNLPSAGSTFVRPKNNYASRLIDLAGLKGYTIGGAQVSAKHSGFIVNIGNATAKDVRELIMYIKKVVYDKFTINLEEEILYLK